MSKHPEPAAWMHRLGEGRLDPRILGQAHFWITADATILPIADPRLMTEEHLRAVITFLHLRAELLHMDALIDALLETIEAGAHGVPSAEQITHDITGSSLASFTPTQYLESTALVRALRRELARRGGSPEAPA